MLARKNSTTTTGMATTTDSFRQCGSLRATRNATTATAITPQYGLSNRITETPGDTLGFGMPSSHEYGHLLAPWNASAIIADTLTTAPSTIGADILRSRVNSRTSGTDPTSTSARNAEPMPEKLPKWCVHLLGVNHSSRNANSVDQPARESLA